MNPLLLDRLRDVIRSGADALTMDDITDCGRIALDPGHQPNKRQNGLGTFLPWAARQGYLTKSGRYERSAAPHRKGGAIAVWAVTSKGREWADGRAES